MNEQERVRVVSALAVILTLAGVAYLAVRMCGIAARRYSKAQDSALSRHSQVDADDWASKPIVSDEPSTDDDSQSSS